MEWFLSTVLIFSITGTLTDAKCHCNTTTACTVFPSTPCSQVDDPDRCQEGWYGSYCQRRNIALGRSATQSSTYIENSVLTGYREHRFAARYGVDGRATTDFYSKPFTCAHTLKGKQTWTVNLDNSNKDTIQHIKLYLRKDIRERYNGMKIYVGGQLCFQWSAVTHPPAIADFKCKKALTGNNLTIQTSDYLALCEVQIFVCSDGWFGEDCDKQCHCSLNTEVCDKITGQCLIGCSSGYMGPDCQTACQDGRYGINCASQCGNCLDDDVCNKSTGMCPRGCAEGWVNDSCALPCPDGYYGLACRVQCGNCVDGNVCIKTNGTCPGGCAAGWVSDRCNQACTEGRYGTNCPSPCGHCLDTDVCDEVTGKCPRGCQPACSDGRHGHHCQSECGQCRGNLPCNKINGTCEQGCRPGFQEPFCKECADGMYGDDCMSRCGQCKDALTCDKSSGECPEGCQGNFMKPLCQD